MSAMDDEFDVVAAWTEEAARALGPGHAVPAGCRGSGSLGSLRWLADRLDLRPGARLVDSGSGVGGPAAWLAGDRQVQPVCVEPMVGAVHASRRLFGLPTVLGAAQALPLADRTADGAWCLGVLCTTDDKAGALAELHRVLVPGGRLGLLVFVQDGPLHAPAPEGNVFPSSAELTTQLAEAGFAVRERAVADLHDNPHEWADAADAVEAEVERRHGDDARWARAQEQSGRMGTLLGSGDLEPLLVVAQRSA
ncbi:class I SAM-dependent methyltransferase [Klenkia sp. LSe6-5]|uniref:Class I SAM-dependent methyltransferase n=1 Tax=Klenkia sesuvii TaxID=3103137 RepID=A0ABU8DWT4_9ACTN